MSKRIENFELYQHSQEELLFAWEQAARLASKLCHVLGAIQHDGRKEIVEKTMNTAIVVMDKIAKAAHSRSRLEFHQSLIDGIDSVFSAVANIYLFREWNMVNGVIYQEIFNEGKKLVQNLQNLNEPVFVLENLN